MSLEIRIESDTGTELLTLPYERFRRWLAFASSEQILAPLESPHFIDSDPPEKRHKTEALRAALENLADQTRRSGDEWRSDPDWAHVDIEPESLVELLEHAIETLEKEETRQTGSTWRVQVI